ncbi:MAG: alpha-mannosidase [Gemmatimonadota bacterium]|nr:alpha-mannosidase [Gemmatimonadota bacterium]
MSHLSPIRHITRPSALPFRTLFLTSLLLVLFLFTCPLAAQSNLEQIYRLAAQVSFPIVTGWRAAKGQVEKGQAPELDDSSWEKFNYQEVLGTEQCWLRVDLELPETIALQPVAGRPVRLCLEVQNRGTAYIDGKKVKTLVPGENRILLTSKAAAGEKYKLAVYLEGRYQRVIFRSALLELEGWGEAVKMAKQLHLTIFTVARLLGTDTRQRGLRIEQDPGIDKAAITESRRARLMEEFRRALGRIDREALEKGTPEAFTASVHKAFQGMPRLTSHLRSYTLYLISNAHIDVAWLWRWRETVEATHDTFKSVLGLMDKYPSLTFSQSQAQLYEWMEDYYPRLFSQIKQKAEQGRWEVVGGMWIEPDCNLISGESWVRQLLYGQRYFKKHFGRYTTFGWNPDSFGYNWNMPQFFSKAGIGVFLTQKLLWNDTNLFPHHLFWWRGPDGSRILVYFPYTGYTNVVNSYQMADDLRQFEANTGLRNMAVLIGYGDHGGGPEEDMLERAADLQKLPVFPRVVFGTASDYIASIADSVKARLPEYSGELYLEYHRGTFTTQARMKKLNRRLEHDLASAEKLSTLNFLASGASFPQQRLEQAWKHVLFNQMHDILPGSGITAVYHDAEEKYARASNLAEKTTRQALLGLASRVNTAGGKGPAGEPLVVFNTLAWPRSGIVRVTMETSPVDSYRVFDSQGSRLPCQIVRPEDTDQAEIIFRAPDVPAMGYRVFRLNRVPGTGSRAPAGLLTASDTRLENEFFLVEISPATGLVTRIFDKRQRREVLAPGGSGNLIELFEDQPRQWDAWNIGYTGVSWKLDSRADRVELVETGPVRATVRVKKSFLGPTKARRRLATSFPSSFFTQEISLYASEPVIEVRNRFDWWEERILCKVAWELAVNSDTAYYEIPMAAIGRPTARKTDWQKARFEVPALRWADLSEPGYGVSLLSESKYGYDVEGSRLRLTALRSPSWPDPAADRGRHEFSFALLPHAGDWRQGGTVHRSREFCTPLYVHRGVIHDGSLPAAGEAFLSAEPENVIVSAFTAAADGDGFILRCHEAHGTGGRATVSFDLRTPARAEEVDLLERPTGKASFRDNTLSFELGPYEIKTFRLRF